MISNPAKNIGNSMPSSEKNSATRCWREKTSSTCGPSSTPLSSSPTASGRRTRRESRGMLMTSTMKTANFANTGRISIAL